MGSLRPFAEGRGLAGLVYSPEDSTASVGIKGNGDPRRFSADTGLDAGQQVGAVYH